MTANAELFTALSKAQGKINAVSKDAKNPFFKSNYATLAAYIEQARPVLAENGLCVIQMMQTTEKGIELVTTIGHSSGASISGSVLMNPTKNDPQGLGSCISYFRRYCYAAALGMVADDDDGHSATHTEQKEQKAAPQQAPKQEFKGPFEKVLNSKDSGEPIKIEYKAPENTDKMSPQQYGKIQAEMNKLPAAKMAQFKALVSGLGLKDVNLATKSQASGLIDWLVKNGKVADKKPISQMDEPPAPSDEDNLGF